MHLFASRDKAFKDDDVLQENVIIMLERGAEQGEVTVTTSTDDSFSDLVTHHYPFDQIVSLADPELFIHVPTSPERPTSEKSGHIRHTLEGLGLKISTGPVVDFRMQEYLCDVPGVGSVPLLYPAHFSGRGIEWPKLGIRKPNAIARNSKTEKWLYPTGYYCVVRRFSSKEEKHRIVACVVDPAKFKNAPMLGFENHLNVFHDNRGGLSNELATGLAVYLSTTVVDENFRRFSGHTQVNATDLKLMKYPSRDRLKMLGEWAIRSGELSQAMIDEKFGKMAE